ncbi:MAG: type I polyketide synthase, partial [Oligoflexales bacterium]|nr:type I polyketide synthase [Oligoflexales bacterium]
SMTKVVDGQIRLVESSPSPWRTLRQGLISDFTAKERKEVLPACSNSKRNWHRHDKPLFGYDACLEFARGKIGAVLGEKFSAIDSHPTRVRLPDEPLLLCHRIMSMDAKPGSMSGGTIVTEHDIFEDAWYLDYGQIPVCIAVEAGQADLFLSSYLGVDLRTKGESVYRLLDASVTFFRPLPGPSETIRYNIRIKEFFSQAGTILFRFEFDASVGGSLLMTMRDGVAGFFSASELDNGRGIVLSSMESAKKKGSLTGGFSYPVEMKRESYDDRKVDSLRRGDYGGCFGGVFLGLQIENPRVLPGGMMTLVHRIIDLDPFAGRYGLGVIRGQSDIHPDDWFLTCHFVDDMVMPGTLMYECCFHTFRIFLMRMGWVSDCESLHSEPILGRSSVLRCRGQVLQSTRKVVYEITPKEIGYDPSAYAIADASMFADGRHIVEIKNITIRYPRLTKQKVEAVWKGVSGAGNTDSGNRKVTFDRKSLEIFSYGPPSQVFGESFRVFDDGGRFIARLPKPPFLFISEITADACLQESLKEGGQVRSTYCFRPDEWYFISEPKGVMPYSILMEAALQPSGWLAAYMGSSLQSERNLYFRNLGGQAVQFRGINSCSSQLIVNVNATKINRSGDLTIQHYDFRVSSGNELIFEGSTYFGFFTMEALANQPGLISPRISDGWSEDRSVFVEKVPLNDLIGICLPERDLLMLDDVSLIKDSAGGRTFVRGIKKIDPEEWFFKAHFHEDPVMPGSLGIEAFLQLLKIASYKIFGGCSGKTDYQLTSGRHSWIYRGQVLPSSREVVVDAIITGVDNEERAVMADGQLVVDGKMIYEMKGYGVKCQV